MPRREPQLKTGSSEFLPQLVQGQLNGLPVAELRRLGKRYRVEGHSRLNKSELIDRLLSFRQSFSENHGCDRGDRLSVEQVAPYWLSAAWNVSEKTSRRAIAALKSDWHQAQLVLRVYRMDDGESQARSRELVGEISIPSSATQWFVQVREDFGVCRLELGYRAVADRFFSLIQSTDLVLSFRLGDFQTRGSQSLRPLERHEDSVEDGDLSLHLEADLLVKGTVAPGCTVIVEEEEVPVQSETGVFFWSQRLENGRTMIPVIVDERGRRQRAVVTIESNIHYLEAEQFLSGSRKSAKE